MNTILKECTLHGTTQFYSYNGKPNKCIICAKKKATEWKRNNPNYLENYQKKYNKEWREKNKEKYSNYMKKHHGLLKERNKKIKEDFYKKFGGIIEKISKDLELKKIYPRIKNIKNPNYENIFNFLLNSKRSEILTYERGRLSSIYKWKVLKRYDMISANEKQIKEISKYKEEAIKITEERIKKILENYKV